MQAYFSKRVPAFDNLRAFLVLVGFPIHTVLFLAMNHEASAASNQLKLEYLTAILSNSEKIYFFGIYYCCVFMMPGFFLLAGFFGHLSYQHRGELIFIVHRLYKIALPFLWCIGWTLPFYFVFFALSWMFPDFIPLSSRDTVTKMYTSSGGWWGIVNHLRETWFLYYLLWFYALTILILELKKFSYFFTVFLTKLDVFLLTLFSSRWLYVSVALLGTLSLSQEENLGWRTSIFTLTPSWGFLAYYVVWYGLGWWLWKHQDKFTTFFKYNGLKIFFSIILYCAFIVWYFCHVSNNNFFYRNIGVFIYELSAALVAFALFGGAWHSVRKSNKILRYISNASYWLYLVQFPIILPFVLYNYNQHDSFIIASIKITVMSTLVALLSYEILVRHTWLNTIFGGKSSS